MTGRNRSTDGWKGLFREWAPAAAVVIAVTTFIVQTRALPDRVTKLEVQAVAIDKSDAVQNEQIKTIVTLLTDIRNDLRDDRNRGR